MYKIRATPTFDVTEHCYYLFDLDRRFLASLCSDRVSCWAASLTRSLWWHSTKSYCMLELQTTWTVCNMSIAKWLYSHLWWKRNFKHKPILVALDCRLIHTKTEMPQKYVNAKYVSVVFSIQRYWNRTPLKHKNFVTPNENDEHNIAKLVAKALGIF